MPATEERNGRLAANDTNESINTDMMRKIIFTCMLLSAVGGSTAAGRHLEETPPATRDSVVELASVAQPTDDSYRIVTNRFWHNWFVFGDVGGHVFDGDDKSYSSFGDRLSADFDIGAGKWFTPGFGIKLQFGMGQSRGSSITETEFTYGNPITAGDGTTYWKMKTKWWDINANVMLNLSRLIYGYEGYGSGRLMNQFILSGGFGGVCQYDLNEMHGWFGNMELQYSRFFSRRKDLSLDIRLRGRFYETNFDGVLRKAQHWDMNLGASIGLTYYFKRRGWERCADHGVQYVTIPVAEPPVPVPCPEYGTLVFYIFFPNNYSGRNDAPAVEGAAVNAIDYIAAGIFTQKRFDNDKSVTSRLDSQKPLSLLGTSDVATEKATACADINGVARGYEMSEQPMSLPMEPGAMKDFYNSTGWYYAPIYAGRNTWYYRVDDATRTQSLLSADNYRESVSYGLNSHAGLRLVREKSASDGDAALYSFADVYAAIEGNEGYISRYADAVAVDSLREIFGKGRILHVQAEGTATSQDNYSGGEEVGLSRNRALSYSRAYTAIRWLQDSGKLVSASPDDFSINALAEPVVTVTDKSTRSVEAKMNRCVKVKISYVIER